MKIGIIGAGAMGQAFARQLVRSGIEAVISNSRGPETLAEIVRGIGPPLIAGTVEEATGPEIVVVAVPWQRVADALANVADWESRIVIDPTNATIDLGGRSSSAVVADLAPGAHVVKAFNTLPPLLLAADPREAGARRVVFFSGDHTRSKIEVGRLIERLGFAGIDLGRLADGGMLQQSPGGVLVGLNLLRLG